MAVQASIDYFEEAKFWNSNELLEYKVVEVALEQMDSVGKVFAEGMKAEKLLFVNSKTGKAKMAPDVAMRLKTVESVRSFIETVRPKVPAFQLNQQINNGSTAHSMSSGLSFEAVLRKKREQHGLKNAQELEVIDGEVNEQDDLKDEFEEFGGDEEEDEEEEED